jgi:translation initiation factor 4E
MATVTPQTPVNGDSSQVDLSTIPVSPDGASDENKKPTGDSEQITVFHDKENFNVKHPLMHKWTLWFTKPPSGKVSQDASIHLPHSDFGFRVTTGTTC